MWKVREAWTKLTFPIFISDMSLDQLTNAYLALPCRETSGGSSVPLWLEHPYRDRELSNLIPYVKRYMSLPVNQRRLRFHPERLKALGTFQTTGMALNGLGFRFAAIDLHLFFNGIGILMMEVCPEMEGTEGMAISWIEDVNAALASIGRGTLLTKKGTHVSAADLLSGNPCTLESISAGRPFELSEFIADVLLAPCESADGQANYQAAVDTFLPAFGAVLLELDEAFTHLRGKDLADHFERFAAEHLTVLRKTLPSNNANVLAHHMFGDPEHNYMPYHNVIHSQSLEGGFVVAFDNGSPHYHGKPAPAMESFRTHYFNIILIALHQRLSILKYTMAAAEASLDNERIGKLQRLREQIYDFTSRCYFTQVSMSEERDQIYRRWQRAFHIPEMYDGLKEEVAEIQDYLANIITTKQTEQRERQIRNDNARTLVFMYITVLFLPITVVLNLITASPVWVPWLNFHRHPLRASVLLILAIVVTALVVLEALRMWRRWLSENEAHR